MGRRPASSRPTSDAELVAHLRANARRHELAARSGRGLPLDVLVLGEHSETAGLLSEAADRLESSSANTKDVDR